MSHSSAVNAGELSEHDQERLKDYLASFDLFKGIEQEGMNYLNTAMRRFMLTLQMVPAAPRPGAQLLELGANPYFITLLLRRFRNYHLTLANYFGDGQPSRGCQVISSAAYGETHELSYDHFNSETEAFPYEDARFDVVLFCEILEHLPLNPTQALYEIHRVLKPGGLVLLTTPNVLAAQNLWRLARGQNIYDAYSGYGVYGRHNREYTPAEAIALLTSCGFELVSLRLDDLYLHPPTMRLLKRYRQHWRDNIFLLARAAGRPRYAYPAQLYRSMHGLVKVVRPEIVMGENDEIQLSTGWYPLETQLMARWSAAEAHAYLLRRKEQRRVCVELNNMNLPDRTFYLEAGGVRQEFPVRGSEWQVLHVDLPGGFDEEEVKVRLITTPTANPQKLGINSDTRELGMYVRRLWLE